MLNLKAVTVLMGLPLLAAISFAADLPSDHVIQASQLPMTSCEEEVSFIVAQAGEPSAPNPPSDVQERAVPRMAPGAKPMTRLEGGMIEGNRLRANPGYTLEPGSSGGVMLRPNGGGLGVEAHCRCVKAGTCSVEISGPSANCIPAKPNPCTNCYMTVGAMGGGMMQRQ